MLRDFTKKAVNIVYCLFCFLALCSGEQIIHYNEKNVTLSLQPDTPLCKKAPDVWSAEKGTEPVFIAEATFEYEKKPGAMEKITQLMQSFSSMQGLLYFSNLKNRTEVLYPHCYTVSGPTSKKAIPDGTAATLNGRKVYFYQEDNSLGSSVYEATYTQTSNEIMLHMKNLQSLSTGLIKTVKPENLHMTLVVSEQYDTIRLYILVQADVISFPLLEKYVEKSFSTRLDAISTWFRTEYEK